ncbi:hypothetical protein [Gemella morbillorum]|uniref:hypothetical protein n=2 Tax=Gemella morbillorum TaxID=29391 RepID=UPI001E5F0151|nr:hypothetical protein [Gemella morbillorum]MDK8239923.1 hypothetical protein [Gemella morbillorum]MDK8255510.1 hypothetical protein [Gemella morbillorum]
MARTRGRIRKYTINMEIKITTYVDNEKALEEKYVGEYIVANTYEKIQYIDKNEKKIKIFIDKMKESVSIEKDNSKMSIEYSRKSSDYTTVYGIMKLDTQLVKINKLARNNLVMHEIIYNIFFDQEKQQNKLKILVKNSGN